MYLAEFVFPGTAQLVSELLIQATSEDRARQFAQQQAANWELEIFALTPATDRQVRLYRVMGKAVSLDGLW